MSGNKPIPGVACSLLASVLMLAVLARELIEFLPFGFLTTSIIIRDVVIPITWAVLILIGALMFYIAPNKYPVVVIILTFSVLSLLHRAEGLLLEFLFWRRFQPPSYATEIPFLDILPIIAGILGIIGGVLGVLWKKSKDASFEESGTKWNLFGLISAILAFNSLALPWWKFVRPDGWILLFPWGAETWQLGITLGDYSSAIYVALTFILISGFLGLLGSLVFGKRGRAFLATAGISATLSVITFAIGLESFLTRVHLHTFYSTLIELAYLSSGFWVALGAVMVAFIALIRHRITPSATPS